MTVTRAGLLILGLLACVACATCLAPSIDSAPVKVTHQNSGPSYEIDRDEEPERVPLNPQQSAGATEGGAAKPAAQEEPAAGQPQDGDQMPIGHVSIRRIFLVPMLRPTRPEWQVGESEPGLWRPTPKSNHDEEREQAAPPMFAKPFWPFMTPARPAHHHTHLFGADEASRSPSGASKPDDEDKAASSNSNERERENNNSEETPFIRAMQILRPTSVAAPTATEQQEPRPSLMGIIDPIQMLMEMMQQAMSGQLAPPSSGEREETPKEAASEERPKMPAAAGEEGDKALGQPLKPANNETREDVVEIEGKKYLRKTVINRHVGDNIIFMTRRLIFTPLNETESASSEQPAIPTTTVAASSTETDAPSTTTGAPTTANSSSEELTTTTTTTTTMSPVEEATTIASTPASSEPTTTAASEQASPTTEQAPVSSSTTSEPKESVVERVEKAIERVAKDAAERLVEKAESLMPSSTVAPAPVASN